MATVSRLRDAARETLRAYPRYALAHLPTPVESLRALSDSTSRIHLFVKRDDQTGLAFGGNKTRKLEYLLADVLAQKADCLITWAGVQSNWCRQLAAASVKAGILPVLLLFKRPGLPSEYDGNLLLDVLFGAEIHLCDLGANRSMMEYESVRDLVDEIADKHRRAGRTPYIAPIGASRTGGSMHKPLGAIGFVSGFLEILDQFQALGIRIGSIVFATGSGSMQAGLLVGAKLFAPEVRIIGISVSEDSDTMGGWVQEMAQETLRELAPDAGIVIDRGDVIVLTDYRGAGYGLLDRETARTMHAAAQKEGLLLDPVYTGRAMLGLLDIAQKGYFERSENVVFLHTGGTPAIFPYRDEILEHLSSCARSEG